MALRIIRNRFLLSIFKKRSLSTNPKLLDVRIENENGIATIIMNRPPVNCLNFDFLKEFDLVLNDLEKANVRGMILGSCSDKVFSAGLDFNEIYKPNRERFSSFWRSLQDTFMHFYNSPFPTAAIITGHAPAGGCLLAACCEYRVMVNNFSIGLNETQVGIPLPSWIALIMANIIGSKNSELAVTAGKIFTSEEALKIGLVDDTCANRKDGLKKVQLFFEQFNNVSPTARNITKQNHRALALEFMEKVKERDLEFTVNFIMQPEFQNHLEKYLTKLKSKSSKL